MTKQILQADLLNCNAIPSISVVQITPDMARQWLERNIGNRPKYLSHVKKLETAIRAGKWKMTGDAIRFSETGKMIDGQHRLQAILDSGMSVPCVVMRELGDDIFDVIDSGKMRGKSDILHIEYGLPVETCGILSTCASIAIDYEKEQYGFGCKADKSEISVFIDANTSIIGAAEYAQMLPRQSPVPRSMAAFFYFHASVKDQDAAQRFLERFMVGAVNGADDNLLHMRNLCLNAKAIRRPISKAETVWRLVKIWNSEQRGTPFKFFSNTAIRSKDAFPRFI